MEVIGAFYADVAFNRQSHCVDAGWADNVGCGFAALWHFAFHELSLKWCGAALR